MNEEERDVAQWRDADLEFERDSAQATLEYCENWALDLVEEYAGHRSDSLAAGLDSIGELLRLGDWLHAEAVWRADCDHAEMSSAESEVSYLSDEIADLKAERDRERASRQAWAEEARVWTEIAQYWYESSENLLHDYDALTLELEKKWGAKRQQAFIASVEAAHPYVSKGYRLDEEPSEIRFEEPAPVCACVSDEQAAEMAAVFSRPQCSVHPQVTASSGDDAATSAAVLPYGGEQ